MDTRSKSFRYSITAKAIAVLILWLSLAGLFSSAFYAVRYSAELGSLDHHATYKYMSEFFRYTGIAYNHAVKQSNTNNLDGIKNFEFLAIDRKTGEITTNINPETAPGLQDKINRLKNQPFNVRLSQEGIEASFTQSLGYGYFENLRQRLAASSIEIYAAAVEPYQKGGAFYDIWYEYTKVHELKTFFLTLSIASALLLIISFVYLVIVAGRREKGGKIVLCFVDRIYTDLQTLLVLLAALLSFLAVRFFSSLGNNPWVLGSYALVLLSVDMLIGLTYVLSIARHIKNGTVFRHTLMFAIAGGFIRLIRLLASAKRFRASTVVLLFVYIIFNSIFLLWTVLSHNKGSIYGFLFWVALNIAAVWFVLKSMVTLTDIMKWVKTISEGSLEQAPDIGRMSPAFYDFACDVGNIQSGMKKAISEAVKGERLKTELIANVSHDLKTPLTSIINYIDLLKQESTENKRIKEYTGILEEKSNRMKVLIDNLLEASKAASGNIQVSLEAIDLHVLVLQAAAEFQEKAAEAGLDLRVKTAEIPPVIRADGTLMWRIMENLFSNVLKYSQKNSRVYLEMESSGGFGVITLKNISEQPLDIPAEQLMERFVRGDRSRTTEGSGLGLGIAKSLAELQGGRLDIKIDGDLFKASVLIPLEN